MTRSAGIPLAVLLVAVWLGGCSFITDTDTSFLDIDPPPEDAGVPECGVELLTVFRHAQHDY